VVEEKDDHLEEPIEEPVPAATGGRPARQEVDEEIELQYPRKKLFRFNNCGNGSPPSSYQDIDYVCSLATPDGNNLLDGDDHTCRLSFYNDGHRECLIITITVIHAARDQEPAYETYHTLYFPHAAFLPSVKVDEVLSDKERTTTPPGESSKANFHVLDDPATEGQGEVKKESEQRDPPTDNSVTPDGDDGVTHTFRLLFPLSSHMVAENILVINCEPTLLRLKEYLGDSTSTETRYLVVHVYEYDHTFLANAKGFEQSVLAKDPLQYLRRWSNPTAQKFIVQTGMFIPSEYRPERLNEGAIPRSIAFFSKAEYIVTQVMGLVERNDVEMDALDAYKAEIRDVRLMRVKGADDRMYLAFFETPSNAVRLQPGDMLRLTSGDIEQCDNAVYLRAKVTNALPTIPINCTSMWLMMNFNHEDQSWSNGPFEIGPAHILPLPTSSNVLTNHDLKKSEPLKARVEIESSEKSFRLKISALQEFTRVCTDDTNPDLVDFVLAQRPCEVPTRNVYDSIDPSHVATHKSLCNEEQQALFNHAADAPAGFVIGQGPPGTGKSFVGAHLCMPFAYSNSSMVLSVSSSNGCVDSNAVLFERLIRSIPEEHFHGQYVVRLHAVDTELAIAKSAGLDRRGGPDKVRPPLVNLDAIAEDTLTSLDLSHAIAKSWQAQHKRYKPLINDPRVTVASFELSVGFNIMVGLGLHPGRPKGNIQLALLSDDDRKVFRVLREKYQQWSNKVKFTEKDEATFNENLKKAREIVLGNATIVSTTPVLSLEAKLYSICDVRTAAIMFDEAGRYEEQTIIAVLARYPSASLRLLVGDPLQLQILLLARGDNDFFDTQYCYSMMARLQDAGVPFVFLRRQYRMARDICSVVNDVGYRQRLISDDSVKYELRPVQNELRRYNQLRYGKERSVIYVNYKFQGICSKKNMNIAGTLLLEPSKSRVNEVYAVGMIELAKSIFDHLEKQQLSTTIAIMSGYTAQVNVLEFALQQLITENSKYHTISVMTFDASQGMEFGVVILDLLLTDRTGFLGKRNRMNVALSRARDAMYVFGSQDQVDIMNDSQPSMVVKEVQTALLRIGAKTRVIKAEGHQSKYLTADDFTFLTNKYTYRIGRSGKTASSQPTLPSNTEESPQAAESGSGSGDNQNPGCGNGWGEVQNPRDEGDATKQSEWDAQADIPMSGAW
jgi:hypothetical protein